MKKRILRVFLALTVFILLLSLPVRADEAELYQNSGADTLMEALPEEAQSLLQNVEVSVSICGKIHRKTNTAAASENSRAISFCPRFKSAPHTAANTAAADTISTVLIAQTPI